MTWLLVGVLAGGIALASGLGTAIGDAVSGAFASTPTSANGELPESALTEIGDGYRLTADAAEAFASLRAAASDAGMTMTVNSAYRSYADQVGMVEAYGLLADGGRAAEPGTSEHGWGTAVDLTLDGAALIWMRENAGTYGFAETIADEPWHWNYVGG